MIIYLCIYMKLAIFDPFNHSPGLKLVFPEAENRMWTVMAVALELLGKKF